MAFSDRGPGATGAPGIDVVADGAYSAGDKTLNTALDGRVAWETWGGTSRSTPVTVGATALVYQAYRKTHPGAIPPNFFTKAKEILKSSSQDLGYDSFTQGSGSVDAGRAVKAAEGSEPTVSPSEWRVGDYRGTEYPVLTHVIAPGASDTQTFKINGGGTWSVSDRSMKRTATERFGVTTSPVGNESAFNFNAPDYLVDISDRVAHHPGADLMVVRAIFPHSEFDPNGDYANDQAWRLLTYNWTDVNHDHRLWTDRDHDGAVDHANRASATDIDGNALIDFPHSEVEKGEYVRFMYHRPGANELMSFVRDPRTRMDDGVFLGLQHTTASKAIARTHFTIEIDWYENADWSWLSAPAKATGSFPAKVTVPDGTPYGMYDGAVVLSRKDESMVVPVSVAVAAQPVQDADGNITGALRFGGPAVQAAQRDLPYNNGSVFGATDWTWRPSPATGGSSSTTWRRPHPTARSSWPTRPGTTRLPSRTSTRSCSGDRPNSYQLVGGSDPFGAPYILDTVGKSQNTNVGAGVWTFDTATGGPREVVTAPAQEGLQALAQHQVGWDGDKFDAGFSTTLGAARVSPSKVALSTASDSGSFDVTFNASVDLDGLEAEGFGLSQPQVTSETVKQDDPERPVHGQRQEERGHQPRLAPARRDLARPGRRPVRGLRRQPRRPVHARRAGGRVGDRDRRRGRGPHPPGGRRLPDLAARFRHHRDAGRAGSTVNAIQGNDLTVTGMPSGPVPAGTPVTLHVTYNKAMTAGQSYLGELLLGPTAAPTAMTVPVQISRTP